MLIIKGLTDLSKVIYNNNKRNGFDSDNFLERMCLITSEVSEAVEDFRNHKSLNKLEYEVDKNGNHKPIGIPSELADIIIRVLDTCGKFDIDIESAMIEKISYNKTRGYMHGGKKA